MKFLRVYFLIIISIMSINPTVGQSVSEIDLAKKRTKIEQSISTLLSKKSFKNNHLISTLTVKFQGCSIILERVYNYKRCSSEIRREKYENIIDLRLLDTNPLKAEIRKPSKLKYQHLGTQISYPFDKSASNKILRAKYLASTIRDQEMKLYPGDVATRLKRLQQRYHDELNYSDFKGSTQIDYYCQGTKIIAPWEGRRARFWVSDQKTKMFLEVLSKYSAQYCGQE